MAKKLSTEEILARARGEVSGGGSAPAEETPAETAPAAEAPAPAANAPAATPSSTADILAAARAQSGGAAKPAETPGSTSDILAAARAQGGGAAAASAKPAAGGAAPKGTNDILAALRAQQSGGAAPAAAAAPKAGAAKQGAPPPIPAGERPSVQEMLAAAKGEPKAEAAPTKPVPPPLPTKPPVAKKKAAPEESRRNVLFSLVASPFAAAWAMFTATAGMATLGLARFMMPNVLVEPPSSFKIGPPGDYPPESVSTKWKSQFGIWVVNANYEGKQLVYALSTVCTHLGCTPNWLGGEQKFKCPCHGSGFYITGVNFEGPAPRPLERYAIRLAPDGMLEVDKSRKFQQELGQWEDPNSKYEVV